MTEVRPVPVIGPQLLSPEWYAMRNPDEKEPYVWSPALHFGSPPGGGLVCLCWFFPSKESCEDWIREYLADRPIPVGDAD
jgi:hypothetical protein